MILLDKRQMESFENINFIIKIKRFCLKDVVFLGEKVSDGVEGTRLEAKDTKKSEAKVRDSPSEDRPSQGQECSRPRTKAQVFSKQNFFSGNLKKKVFKEVFVSARVT